MMIGRSVAKLAPGGTMARARADHLLQIPTAVTPPSEHPPRVLILGSSDGIGQGLACRLRDAGWQVTGLSRSRSGALGDGEGVLQVVRDAAEPGLDAALDGLWDSRGPFDLVVHCIAVGTGLDAHGLSQETRTFRINLQSLVAVVERLLPRMQERGRGHLIGLSSLADCLHLHDAPSYSATKAGYSNYLRALALHCKDSGVAVTNVRFGFVDTKMAQSPVKPMLKTVDQAVDVLLRCIRRRPVQLSWPKRMAVLVWGMRKVQDLGMWFRRQG